VEENELHTSNEKYYKEEFDFPDFITNFLCCFIVEQEGNIICAAGVRTIAEVILITDKDFPVRSRRGSLYNVLDASSFIAGKMGYNALHAFITDLTWKEHLSNVGFHPIKGDGLILEL